MEKLNPITVLITGVGAPGAPGIIKSLRKNRERDITILGVDINPDNSGVSQVDVFYKIPKPDDKQFIPSLLNICKHKKVDVVLPLVTKELFIFAKNVELFKSHGIRIPISPSNALETANNKAKLLAVLKKCSIAVPEHYHVTELKEFIEAVKVLGYPEKTVCFKPPVSNGSRGFRIIDDSIDQLDLLMNYKPNNTYISYKNIIEILENADELPELLVMEYLPGEEYSVDLLVDRGKALYIIPRLRDVIRAGISHVGTSQNNTGLIDYCESIVKVLGLHGNIGIQVKADRDSRFRILEINPRVQGTIVLRTASGVNLPYMRLKLALQESISKEMKVNWETKMFRHYNEIYKNAQGRYFEL
ncbi:MAG: ATP-grasp domain-containing protein [Calditrichia bacterium]|nr:ATP-grasp domain-containing protein [Calditrichia bacterium]